MATGKHLPKHFAQWTLSNLYEGLNHWAFEYYDNECHSTLGMSPKEAYERSLTLHGTRAQKRVLLNQDLLIATCPTVDREGTRTVDSQRGVKVNNLYYWNPVFHESKWSRKSVEVRMDPWDASSVYVHLKNEWVQARCRNLLVMGQLTEMERIALSNEYTSQNKGRTVMNSSPQRLAEFMRTFTPKGVMALEFERQQENKEHYSRIGIANISPVEPVQHRSFQLPDVESKQVPQLRKQHTQKTSNSLIQLTQSPLGAQEELLDFDEF